jgi:hypothetical protein
VRSERVTFLFELLPLPALLALVAALPLIVGARAAAAAADGDSATARLEVQALPDCTSREEVAARVAARSRRIHFDDDAAGPTLRALIAAGPRGGAVGELVIVQPDGRTSTRRLSAPSCAAATDAIALIIALTLDPAVAAAAGPATATTSGHPAATAGRPAAAPSRTTATGTVTESAVPPAPTPTPAPSEPPHVSAEPATAPAVAAAPPPPARSGANAEPAVLVASVRPPPVATQGRFGGGAFGQAIFGPAPDALPGIGVYLVAALDRDALWSPAIAISAMHAWSSALIEPGGTATFTLDAASLDACALRLHLAFWEARACATALYGRLAATGSDTYSPASASRPFAAIGGAALMSVELGQLFELTGRIGAAASLVRDSFAFSPTVFHRTAAVTVTAGLGVGVRFP